jgi:hypothetical protein
MEQPPQWFEVLTAPVVASEDSSLQALDLGERAAILLAESINADLLLIDDRAGAILVQRRRLAVTGTLECWIWPLRQGCFVCRTPSYSCRKPTSDILPRSWRYCWRKREAARKEIVSNFLHQKMIDHNQMPQLSRGAKDGPPDSNACLPA